ncbi:MAG: LOG family protein [Arsenophonus sp. NC-WZS1-MAG3]
MTEIYIIDIWYQLKQKMIDLADVFIALLGGLGTLKESSEIFTLGSNWFIYETM